MLSAALKKRELDAEGYRQLIDHTTRLNAVGTQLGTNEDIHAMTDVTGFGLLGHLLEICRGSYLSAAVNFAKLPIIPQALELARRDYSTGAASRNWMSYGESVILDSAVCDWHRKLLCDPQTSGGLLVACGARAADSVLGLFHSEGFSDAAVIGSLDEGPCQVFVTAA